eukprot:TRINITY_DN3077_c0_g1_i2.p1 TRINITY_DN3077_c0_g1~~TRINITY_DN3077_c0_g1_i2.p1  ORF type:complete len:702 (+),score=197.94 TRINITY_DN3077_c0_g1_i2:235-2340(+)
MDVDTREISPSDRKRRLESYDDLYSDEDEDQRRYRLEKESQKRVRSASPDSKSSSSRDHASSSSKSSSSSSSNRDRDRDREKDRQHDRRPESSRDRDRDRRDNRDSRDHNDRSKDRDRDRRDHRDGRSERDRSRDKSDRRDRDQRDNREDRSKRKTDEEIRAEREAEERKKKEEEERKKKEEEEAFRQRVEMQMQQMTEDTEEEIIRKRRERRKAILEKHQPLPGQEASAPTTPNGVAAAEPISEKVKTENTADIKAEIIAQIKTEIKAENGAEKHEKKTETDDIFTGESHHVAPHTPAAPIRGAVKDSEDGTGEIRKIDDDFDVFGGDDDIFADKDEPILKRDLSEAVAVAANASEVTDDAEGYYCYRMGEVINKRYSLLGNFGKGVYSTVIRARDMLSDEREVAIKILRNNDVMRRAGLKEIQILKDLAAADPQNKYNIVRLLDSFEGRDHLCLVFEPMNGGNLREVLKKYGTNIGLNIKAVKTYAQKMLLALKLLKKVKILHSDIKPDNILVNEQKTSIKLADLGSASAVTENQITPYLASRFYRAPEVMLGLAYGYPMDMWAIACCLYEISTGKILFPGRSNNEMLFMQMEVCGPFPKKLLKRGEFSSQHFEENGSIRRLMKDKITGKDYVKIHSFQKATRDIKDELLNSSPYELDAEEKRLIVQLWELLSQMLVLDPAQRISVEEALRHPFIASLQ